MWEPLEPRSISVILQLSLACLYVSQTRQISSPNLFYPIFALAFTAAAQSCPPLSSSNSTIGACLQDFTVIGRPTGSLP
jgi:hypothetical protein